MTEEMTILSIPEEVTTPPQPAIYAAIEAIQAGVGVIPKNGHMDFGKTKYDYVTNDDILLEITKLLQANHVIVRPNLLGMQTEARDIGANRTIPIVVVQLEQTYISTIDGSNFAIKVFGEASGTDDKGLRKAVTQAQKIANLLTFSIATGEPDPDGIPTPEPAAAPATTAAARKTPPATKVQGAEGESVLEKLKTNVKTAAQKKGLSMSELNARGNEIHSNFIGNTAALELLLKSINELPDTE